MVFLIRRGQLTLDHPLWHLFCQNAFPSVFSVLHGMTESSSFQLEVLAMAARPNWSGYLKFHLISVPVIAYNAVTSGGKIGFHLLHAKCHQRIQYKKVCPIHGEVTNDEIVSGYEVSKGHYVVVDKEERAGVKIEDDKIISVDTFVHPDALDPNYYSGRSYFLVPDGKVAQKTYGVMLDAMRKRALYAIAQVVFAGRAQLAAVHPAGHVLAMTLLSYASELKKPEAFADEVVETTASSEEHKLAESLLDAFTSEKFDLGRYTDEYTCKLAKLVGGKAKHAKKIVETRDREEPTVINLMDALRQSLARTKKGQTKTAAKKSPGHAAKKGMHHARRKTA
jgi:DNA end-binding protein Ku